MSTIDRTGFSLPAIAPTVLDRTTQHNTSPKEVGKAFEGMFASILIKQMRQSLGGSGLFSHDPGDVFGGLFDHFLGQHLAQNGGLGIARMMEKQLDKRSKKT